MKFLYLFLLSLPFQTVFAQKTIFAVHVDGGLSAFSGASTVGVTNVSTGGVFCHCEPSPAQVFGSKTAFSYGAGLVIQREFKNRIRIGLDAAYEMLRTRMNVKTYTIDDMVMVTNGKSISSHQFVNLFPHIGYRIPLGNELSLAVNGGADFGIGLNSYEKLYVPEYFKESLRTNTDLVPGLDFRPRVQVQLISGKFGFNVSYSNGVKNWMADWIGGNPKAYMKVVRVGMQYQLN
ncbi:hypothetical protein [Dyadobacter luticola]|uniref:PorT family protein n=1 Tax=Dyadobacter luticola TaxID=1979387 RepID=A0A5R9KSK5_9BACT|nr:hypothetical protein [Dyadobacter luticola]TLU99098.1 hypothetical protein FEN17_21205 [Dyadobacter luticola]